jgi:glycosyltransferase involved in cell wall biosynthesis
MAENQQYDVLCFSHLRWDFVYQRPQHLLSRFARDRKVFFIEEPFEHEGADELRMSEREGRLTVVVPYLSSSGELPADQRVRAMIHPFVEKAGLENYINWFYSPMMVEWADGLEPLAVVYDCMDELSAFRGAPPELVEREKRLFELADLVFTGGHSLYEAKKERHPAVFAFPSSIDADHFRKAAAIENDPDDQAPIPRPRAGFYGVIDERTDIELLGQMADLRPQIQFIMIGPVVKIDPAELPQRPNIHYLGGKTYDELPGYLSGWDVAIMPFAMNESTRFISPTKTPEFLAAGKPVVSTPIRDVVRPYGEMGMVQIAGTAEEFVEAIDKALVQDSPERRAAADDFISQMSWDKTFNQMSALIYNAVKRRSLEAAGG